MIPSLQSIDESSIWNRPVVSVIIPTFNRAAWLPRSIGSVQNQLFTDWELLVVDDGSTDGSESLLEQMAAEDTRIRPVKNLRTKGVSGARNTGIEAARGEYIAFLDSDDEWFPQHLERSLQALVQSDGVAEATSAVAERRREETGELFGGDRPVEQAERVDTGSVGQLLDPAQILKEYLAGRGPLEIQTFVVRRDAVGDVRFPEDLRMGEDGFFFALLARKGVRILRIPSVHVILWAHHSNTTSAGGRAVPFIDLVRIYEDLERLGEKTLATFELTRGQRKHIHNMMAAGRFWQIGYNGYLREKRYSEARRSFRKAMGWQPGNVAFLRTYLLSFIREGLRL